MNKYGDNVGIVPLTDAAGITGNFIAGKHYGIDIAWSSKAADPNCPVLAWQDGTVVDCGSGAEVGNFIVVEHDYNDGHRWTGYIHLKDIPSVKKGDKVVFGKQMGNARRGNTGNSTGVHLHMYLTRIVSKRIKYKWANLINYAIDPRPYLYYSKEYNTEYISKDWKKPLPDPLPEVTAPVERDISRDQIICHDADLRVRTRPDLSGVVIGHLEKDKYYNCLGLSDADGYEWIQIAEDQYCARVSSVDLLPAALILAAGDRLVIDHYDSKTITFRIERK